MKRSQACCFCKTRRIRGARYRDCRQCHAANQAKTRARTISTVLPQDFFEWPEDEQESYVLEFIQQAIAAKRASVPRATIPHGTESQH